MKRALKLFVCIFLVFCTVVCCGCGQEKTLDSVLYEVQQAQPCYNCGYLPGSNESFCSQCGVQFSTISPCNNCGYLPRNYDSFCARCGIQLDTVTPSECEEILCGNCGGVCPSYNSFCTDCGKPLGAPTMSDSEALLGTWEAYDDPWGRFTYSFFADGYCMGEYWGHVGGVDPSLYPGSYYIGSGDGNWSFFQGELIPMLKVSYIGESDGDQAGTQYYEYAFNEDYTELTIYGVDTHGDRARGSIVWRKISD